jgi:hypothetical protein
MLHLDLHFSMPRSLAIRWQSKNTIKITKEANAKLQHHKGVVLAYPIENKRPFLHHTVEWHCRAVVMEVHCAPCPSWVRKSDLGSLQAHLAIPQVELGYQTWGPSWVRKSDLCSLQAHLAIPQVELGYQTWGPSWVRKSDLGSPKGEVDLVIWQNSKIVMCNPQLENAHLTMLTSELGNFDLAIWQKWKLANRKIELGTM